jgi:hypothetical protein
MMKIFRDKRGVSPVVSAMIMIVVVMVGMSAIFGFIINYNRDFQSGSGSAVFESMTVEDVWFRSDRVAEMWIFNLGKVSMDISYVYVNGDAVSFDNSFPSEDLTVDVGEHLKIVVFSDFVEGYSYVFRVATSRGTTFEGIWTR